MLEHDIDHVLFSEEQLKKRVPGFHQLLHGSIDATLAVHLGPHLLGAGIQFLPTTPPPV